MRSTAPAAACKGKEGYLHEEEKWQKSYSNGRPHILYGRPPILHFPYLAIFPDWPQNQSSVLLPRLTFRSTESDMRSTAPGEKSTNGRPHKGTGRPLLKPLPTLSQNFEGSKMLILCLLTTLTFRSTEIDVRSTAHKYQKTNGRPHQPNGRPQKSISRPIGRPLRTIGRPLARCVTWDADDRSTARDKRSTAGGRFLMVISLVQLSNPEIF